MKCAKCGTPIVSHIWWVWERGIQVALCSPSCERGGKSQFEKVYKALKKN